MYVGDPHLVRIMALDPGTENTGWAVLLGDIHKKAVRLTNGFGVIRTKKSDGSVRERIDHIGEELQKIMDPKHGFNPTHLVLEDFTEQGKFVGKTYKEMSWLIEHLRMVGRGLGIDTELVENGFWKKMLMGAQRVNKHQVQHYVSHRLPEANELLKGQPDHVWDSVAIGLYKFNLLCQ